MTMKDSTKSVLRYLQQADGNEEFTANDVAMALSLSPRTVNGAFTAFANKGLGYRKVVKTEAEDGSQKKITFFILTDEGKQYNPDAE